MAEGLNASDSDIVFASKVSLDVSMTGIATAGRILCVLLLLAGLSQAADRRAQRAYREGQRLEKAGKFREALDAYTRAAELAPNHPRMILRREMARQRAAFQHVSAGLRLVRKKRYAEAVSQFEQASELDPSNEFARQQLESAREAADLAAGRKRSLPPAPSLPAIGPLLALQPRPVRRAWNLRGDPHALFLALGAFYGIQFEFEDAVPRDRARFRLEEADFSTAVRVLAAVTGTIVAPLSERVAVVALDTPQNRKQFERQVLQHLVVNELATPEAITEVANALRALLEMKFVRPNPVGKVITVRDSAAKVQAAERLVRALNVGRPEVLLQLETLEVRSGRSRELGLLSLQQASVFKLSPVAGRVQSGVAVPLPQLFGRALATAGAVSQLPLGTFGGGLSFFGVTLPGMEFRARLSEVLVRTISTLTVRGSDGQPAVLMVGERFPVVNAIYSPAFATDIGQGQQPGTLINPVPSFTFEDIGIKVQVTPRIHNDQEISLQVQAHVRSLTGQTFSGLPSFTNRETEQVVRVRNGQATLITGILSREERRSLVGTAFLAEVPVLGALFGQRTRETAETDVILLLTPHILRAPAGPLAAREIITLPRNYVPVKR